MKFPLHDSEGRGYVLKPASLRDIRAIYRLQHVIFPRDAYPYLDLFLLFILPRIKNLKITARDESLVGFVSLGPAISVLERKWIITIGIDPDHQQQGLGTWLLSVAERCVPERPCTRLTVRESNMPALNLYQKTGYTHITRKPGYYLDGEAGLVMEKCLDAESLFETDESG